LSKVITEIHDFLAQFAGFVADAPMTTPWRNQKLTLFSGQIIYNKAMFPGNGGRPLHV
jgi:hypothetical protein